MATTLFKFFTLCLPKNFGGAIYAKEGCQEKEQDTINFEAVAFHLC